jgi:hypothetical protein
MAKIKGELFKVGMLLENTQEIPGVWSYLVPISLGRFRKPVIKFCERWFGGGVIQKRKCKLIIFVDDLDRCTPEKAVEVLQSLILLTEDTPFVVFLAIDPRIIVTAIESVNAKFFTESGVSGYEYLDKIVHIPFAIPPMVNSEKFALCEGYLMREKLPPKLTATFSGSFYDSTDDYLFGAATEETMKTKCKKLKVIFQAKDNGWGDTKGGLEVRLVNAQNEVLAIGRKWPETFPHNFEGFEGSFDETDPIVSLSGPKCRYEVWYKVGGGGGHALYIENFFLIASF